jgi:TonB family protein
MRTAAVRQSEEDDDLFSTSEIAQAAGVAVPRVDGLIRTGQVAVHGRYVGRRDAIKLVRLLGGIAQSSRLSRSPLTVIPDTRRRQGVPLAVSIGAHGAFLLALLLLTSSLFRSNETEMTINDPQPLRLVYFMAPRPSGGGGGGGLPAAVLPPRAERKAVVPPRHLNSPVPIAHKIPAPRPVAVEPPHPQEPPRPLEPPKIDPPPVDPPKVDPPAPAPPRVDPPKPAAQSVQAPVAPAPAANTNLIGDLTHTARGANLGAGLGAGVGGNAGTGIGEGRGSGLGAGSDSGTGGGPFRPGADIQPPSLLKEVKPVYTDDARKRAIAGDVVLEIVVRRDGSVGNLRVTHSLGAGLDERAMDAVRQWKFSPAHRFGAPVDVIVEVSVEFKLR